MENLLPWFKLKSAPGIGNLLFKRLVDRFELPERIYRASREELLGVEGMTPRLVDGLFGHKTPDTVKKEIDRVARSGCEIVTMADRTYPPLLLHIPDPPPFLYVYGRLDGAEGNVSVVGSRHATGYGIGTTRRLCRELAALKINIVSGMAKGIDTAAHEGALEGRGKTFAVLGSGLARVYPASNSKLFHTIAENGAVISEFPLETEPEPHNFPRRNRIISGMSLGTVVVEATRRSGALITARLAAEQNREVFAVPGNIHSFKSTGTHTLIKQGAKLVENARDIIEELLLPSGGVFEDTRSVEANKPGANILLSPEESMVLDALSPYPVHIDELVRRLSMAPGKLSSLLLQLELKGVVDQAPGKRFSTAAT